MCSSQGSCEHRSLPGGRGCRPQPYATPRHLASMPSAGSSLDLGWFPEHVQRGDNPHPTSPLLSYACTERGQPPTPPHPCFPLHVQRGDNPLTPPHPCPLHLFCCELLTSAASISLDSGFLFPQFGESPRLPLGSPSPRALGTRSLQSAGNYGTYFVRLFSPRNYCPGDWDPVSCRLLFLCVFQMWKVGGRVSLYSGNAGPRL